MLRLRITERTNKIRFQMILFIFMKNLIIVCYVLETSST